MPVQRPFLGQSLLLHRMQSTDSPLPHFKSSTTWLRVLKHSLVLHRTAGPQVALQAEYSLQGPHLNSETRIRYFKPFLKQRATRFWFGILLEYTATGWLVSWMNSLKIGNLTFALWEKCRRLNLNSLKCLSRMSKWTRMSPLVTGCAGSYFSPVLPIHIPTPHLTPPFCPDCLKIGAHATGPAQHQINLLSVAYPMHQGSRHDDGLSFKKIVVFGQI